MTPRRAAAAATGWYYRVARRGGISTAASRQAVLHRSRTLPDRPHLVVAGPDSDQPLRVMLLGNGPVEDPGLPEGSVGFSAALAQALSLRALRRVEVKTLLGAGWDLPSLERLLHDEQVHLHDALVVSAAYRPHLAEVPLRRWEAYTQSLRAMLVRAAGKHTVIRVLSLPWHQAAADAPTQWGGLFGNRVAVVAEIAETALRSGQPALPLRLHAPLMKKEWIGPEFSAQTYARWADQVAVEVTEALGL